MRKRLSATFLLMVIALLAVRYWDLLAGGEGLMELARASPLLGPVAIVLVMIAQSVVAPIPAASVAVVAGSLYGMTGALYVGIGALFGALISFYIARRYGKGYVEGHFDPGAVEKMNSLVDRYGFWAILVARLFPWVSFDLISYVAGITRISFKRFITATLLGMIPGTIVYVKLGTFFESIAYTRFAVPLAGILILILYLKRGTLLRGRTVAA